MTSTNANDNPGSDAEGAVDPATVASPRTAAADLPPVNEGTADLGLSFAFVEVTPPA